MRGKYSPTVNLAYMKDQEWWRKYSYDRQPGDNWIQYDPEGYDSYGYNKDDVDRAGNSEYMYYSDDFNFDDDGFGENYRYNQALEDWGFDGVKPVPNHPQAVVGTTMNDRLMAIAQKSGVSVLYDYSSDGHACVLNLTDLAKFAELIILESAHVAWLNSTEDNDAHTKIKQHFGVDL
jgi:hypothetical protein